MHCHCGTNNRAPWWTFTDPCKPEAKPGAWEESASPSWIAAPAMNARDTTKVYIWRLDTGCGATLYRKCHSHKKQALIFHQAFTLHERLFSSKTVAEGCSKLKSPETRQVQERSVERKDCMNFKCLFSEGIKANIPLVYREITGVLAAEKKSKDLTQSYDKSP